MHGGLRLWDGSAVLRTGYLVPSTAVPLRHSSAAKHSWGVPPGLSTQYVGCTQYFSGLRASSHYYPPMPPRPFPDSTDPTPIAEWLMSTDSTSGAEERLMHAFADALATRGWAV